MNSSPFFLLSKDAFYFVSPTAFGNKRTKKNVQYLWNSESLGRIFTYWPWTCTDHEHMICVHMISSCTFLTSVGRTLHFSNNTVNFLYEEHCRDFPELSLYYCFQSIFLQPELVVNENGVEMTCWFIFVLPQMM